MIYQIYNHHGKKNQNDTKFIIKYFAFSLFFYDIIKKNTHTKKKKKKRIFFFFTICYGSKLKLKHYFLYRLIIDTIFKRFSTPNENK